MPPFWATTPKATPLAETTTLPKSFRLDPSPPLSIVTSPEADMFTPVAVPKTSSTPPPLMVPPRVLPPAATNSLPPPLTLTVSPEPPASTLTVPPLLTVSKLARPPDCTICKPPDKTELLRAVPPDWTICDPPPLICA